MAGTATAREIYATAQAIGFLFGVLVNWLYFTLSESSAWQATLGKKLVGLTVTDERGGRLGFGQANGRYWSKLTSALILGIGFLMAGFTERKQALHDKIAGTLVLKGRPSTAMEPTTIAPNNVVMSN